MKKKFRGSCLLILFLVSCITGVFAGSASGAGFALIEQGVKGLGNAYAGGSASAEDATTIFFNPAGLTRLDGNQVVAGVHMIMPYANFENQGSNHVSGAPLRGDDDGNGVNSRLVPNFYYSRKLSERFSVGLGVNAPFGLATEYDKDWVGRYHAIKSDLVTVNINPSAAYKVTDKLSIGAGFNVQYLDAELSNAVDFGTVGFLFGIPGLLPQHNDGFVSLEGDSWGVGFNVGLLYEFTRNTRIGLGYRSAIDQDLEGDADFENVPLPLRSSFGDSDVKADVTLPDSLSVSFFHHIDPKWKIMADFTWTDWRHFRELVVNFDNGQPASTTTENWQDNYRTSLGVTFTPAGNWTFRAGTAYDTSAVRDKQHRTPRVPDAERIWAALGIGYKVSDTFNFDLGYTHIFMNDPQIYKQPTGEDRLRGGLKGTYDAYINIVSAQLTVQF